MGRFVNPQGTEFEKVLQCGLFVDKTELIAYVNAVMNSPWRFVCVTRPHGFGKTAAAEMLTAFYSKGADSRAVFEKLKAARTPGDRFFLKAPPFDQYLNRCNVIRWSMADFAAGGDIEKTMARLQSVLVSELQCEFPRAPATSASTLAEVICAVTAATGERFYLIIDEWDWLFRKAPDDEPLQKQWLDFLRGLFKGTRTAGCLCGAFLTGILPLKKGGTSSSLADFTESTMVNPGELAAQLGFTTDEVRNVCRASGADFSAMQRWFGGSLRDGAKSVFNPRAVLQAAVSRQFEGLVDAAEIGELLGRCRNLAGFKESVAALLDGGRCRIDAGSFVNDLVTLHARDQALTLLVHWGILTYDVETSEVCLPNEAARAALAGDL